MVNVNCANGRERMIDGKVYSMEFKTLEVECEFDGKVCAGICKDYKQRREKCEN